MFGVVIGAAVITLVTSLGGFRAVAWTDLFQGLLVAGALIALPLYAVARLGGFGALVSGLGAIEPELLTAAGGRIGPALWGFVIGQLGIGLGYPGMPHVITRYMAARDDREVRAMQFTGQMNAVVRVIEETPFLISHRQPLGPPVQGDHVTAEIQPLRHAAHVHLVADEHPLKARPGRDVFRQQRVEPDPSLRTSVGQADQPIGQAVGEALLAAGGVVGQAVDMMNQADADPHEMLGEQRWPVEQGGVEADQLRV